jgi:hypothetical protein
VLNALGIDAFVHLQYVPWTWRLLDRAYEIRERSRISMRAGYL